MLRASLRLSHLACARTQVFNCRTGAILTELYATQSARHILAICIRTQCVEGDGAKVAGVIWRVSEVRLSRRFLVTARTGDRPFRCLCYLKLFGLLLTHCAIPAPFLLVRFLHASNAWQAGKVCKLIGSLRAFL